MKELSCLLDPRERAGTGADDATLRFVPHEDLQALGYGAYRKLLNQAVKTEGAKQ